MIELSIELLRYWLVCTWSVMAVVTSQLLPSIYNHFIGGLLTQSGGFKTLILPAPARNVPGPWHWFVQIDVKMENGKCRGLHMFMIYFPKHQTFCNENFQPSKNESLWRELVGKIKRTLKLSKKKLIKMFSWRCLTIWNKRSIQPIQMVWIAS